MIKFKWEIFRGEENESDRIGWEATWNGTNEDDPFYYEDFKDVHPFWRIHDFDVMKELLKEGKINSFDPLDEDFKSCADVVARNEATESICKLIQMSLENPEEFRKHNGYTDAFHYRMQLLQCLNILWD